VKGQSNPEISRSPRNSFRASRGRTMAEVEHWTSEGASPPAEENQTPNAAIPLAASQSMWAKLCAREGNSPDRPLRPPSPCRVAKDVRLPRQPGCWLRSSHAFKECVTAHWSSGHAPTIHGAKRDAEAAGRTSWSGGRGAFRLGRSRRVTDGGPGGSENAGMSSESGAGNAAAVSLRFPGQG
jgi:hypothetical protein